MRRTAVLALFLAHCFELDGFSTGFLHLQPLGLGLSRIAGTESVNSACGFITAANSRPLPGRSKNFVSKQSLDVVGSVVGPPGGIRNEHAFGSRADSDTIGLTRRATFLGSSYSLGSDNCLDWTMGSRGHESTVLSAQFDAGEDGDTNSDDSSASLQGTRINKCFAHFASRREADSFISDGRVEINGRAAENGHRVFPGDKVSLDGKPINWEKATIGREANPRNPHVYIKYWKPRGVVCTTDQSINNNIIDRVKHPERIFMVGRLDRDSTGLILLTSDGRLPNTVLKKEQKHDKEYIVTTDRAVSQQDIAKLAEGVVITTVAQRDRTVKPLTAPTLPCRVERLGPKILRITLQEGRNRQIRKMLDALGHEVVDLHREKVAC